MADYVVVDLFRYSQNGGKAVNLTYVNEAQIWVGRTKESPVYGRGADYEAVDGNYEIKQDLPLKFNQDESEKYNFHWTATYRRDSDVYVPYGQLEQGNQVVNSSLFLEELRKSLPQKKLVTWLVSHCGAHSQRDIFVDTLKRFIPVDIFGLCNVEECPETVGGSCLDTLGATYKFYLALENSLCLDYVTEKFFKTFDYSMVPVTYGWGDYSLVGPPGSYINALDFESVEDLANHLLFLHHNDSEYMKYFEWRRDGRYRVTQFRSGERLCAVCQQISEHKKKSLESGTYCSSETVP